MLRSLNDVIFAAEASHDLMMICVLELSQVLYMCRPYGLIVQFRWTRHLTHHGCDKGTVLSLAIDVEYLLSFVTCGHVLSHFRPFKLVVEFLSSLSSACRDIFAATVQI